MSQVNKVCIGGLLFLIGIQVHATEAQIFDVGPVASQVNIPWPSPRFTAYPNSGGACEIDNLTGLMWVRGLNVSPYSSPVNWSGANTDINNLNTSSGLCGFKDWRLPNINELKSLVNYQDTTSPAHWLNNLAGFSGVQSTVGTGYWSSTQVVGISGEAWFAGMDLGGSGPTSESNTSDYYVWPVRAGAGL